MSAAPAPRPERVLVTGASRGIGRAVALRLASSGRLVIGVARDEERLEALRSAEPSIAVLAADLSDPVQLRSVVARGVSALGGLDALVSCASFAAHQPLHEVDEDQLAAQFAIDVRAPLILARDLAAHLREEGRPGAIVTVSSTLALQGASGTSVYSACKGALVSMTRALAVELAPDVRVSCVVPGGVDTDMVRGREEALAALHPLGRLATADEIAGAIVFALDAPFVTGSLLVIDGGLTAGR